MPETMKGITVTGVEVSDFRRIKLARVEMVPGTGLVRVTGKNGAGKTSLLKSIRAALGGAGEVHPTSLRDGSDGAGEVLLRLSNDFTVRRRITEANPKGYLTVEAPDGGRHNQGKLDEWLGPLSFDPLAFFDLRADRQQEILLSLGEDPELPAKLDALRGERQEVYDERTPWISTRRRMAQVPRPEGIRPEPIDVSAEMRRMGELQMQERERQDAERAVSQAQESVQRMHGRVQTAQQEVERLEEALRRARSAVGVEKDNLQGAVEELDIARSELESIADPAEEMEQVRGRIEAADAVHEALEPWKEWERAQAAAEQAREYEEELTARIEEIDDAEARLIRRAGIPVEGLSFSDDGDPLLDGRPLGVASGAERSRLAVAVAMAVNPELRICLLDEEANGLDLESLEELDRLARENDFQVWAVRLGLEGDGEVVVADGEAWDRDAEREEVAADA